MKVLFCSPHDDDNALFGAFTCMREHPVVLVCTDSYIQDKRGEKNCDAWTRAKETLAAAQVLSVDVRRLSIPDDAVTEELLEVHLELFKAFSEDWGKVYAPAEQGGNPHHDMVSRAAKKVFGDKVIYYTTYTKTEPHTTGNIEIAPTGAELELKGKALQCYVSQINLPSTKMYFEAQEGKSEWLV